MPTLIAITPENSGPRMTDVPYIVPCDYVAGQPEPEFFKGRRTGRWQRNPAVNHGPITEGAARANTHEHARRATPEEIAAQGPSVGRPADLPENIQWLPHSGPRVETGPLQVGDDWPGVFIRGDNAGWYALQLTAYLTREDEGAIPQLTLRGLVEVLNGCILGPAKDLIPTAPSVGRDELVELLCGALEASLDLWDMGQEANSSLTQMDRYQELDRRKDQIVERARAALAAAGRMATSNDGGPAFLPVSLRDYLAAHAPPVPDVAMSRFLQCMATNEPEHWGPNALTWNEGNLTDIAYQEARWRVAYADAVLHALKKVPQ